MGEATARLENWSGDDYRVVLKQDRTSCARATVLAARYPGHHKDGVEPLIGQLLGHSPYPAAVSTTAVSSGRSRPRRRLGRCHPIDCAPGPRDRGTGMCPKPLRSSTPPQFAPMVTGGFARLGLTVRVHRVLAACALRPKSIGVTRGDAF